MTTFTQSFTQLSNHDLLDLVKRLAAAERQATAVLIASLMEVDARRLYLADAYGRIEAARAARRFPEIQELLAEGAITLTAVGLLAPHLTDTNHVELLNSARHKIKREVEQLVVQLHPRPDVPSSIRRLPTPKIRASSQAPAGDALPAGDRHEPGPPVPAPSNAPVLPAPLAPERYKVQFTVGRATYEKLRRAQDLLRHTIPSGDPAAEPPSRCALGRPRSQSHASHSRRGEANRLGARRGAVRLCREHGTLR